MKIFIILLLCLSSLTHAQTKLSKGDVTFLASGKPAFITIEGKGSLEAKSLTIDGETISLNLNLPVASMDTGIELRDSHLKEKYLEIDKFPNISLSINQHNLNSKTFKATLELHGVSREISGIVNSVQNNNELEIEAEFEVNLEDYSIEIPNFQGITVAKTVKIKPSLKIIR